MYLCFNVERKMENVNINYSFIPFVNNDKIGMLFLNGSQ